VIKNHRTARARTSAENLFVVLLVMAPSSQELEPPANPGRVTHKVPKKTKRKRKPKAGPGRD
jgi:hypothetical protein